MTAALRSAGAAVYGAAWEARRWAYAQGLRRPERIAAGVVSVGNLSVGGAGKTTLTLRLAEAALAAGVDVAVVTRRYRPGPEGRGDEELLFERALGSARVHAGDVKRTLAADAARAGRTLVLVDDGFSHWRLARDLDLVLLEADEAAGRGRLLPAGRLREPWRALQRAEIVVVSRLAHGEDPAPHLAAAARWAPAALLAAGRHAVRGARRLDGTPAAAAGAARVVTATGNPAAVARTAHEAGFEVLGLSAYRDHHWFGAGEARRELERARADGAALLLTAKDAVRWPRAAADERVLVLEVAWEWLAHGAEVEARVLAAAATGGTR